MFHSTNFIAHHLEFSRVPSIKERGNSSMSKGGEADDFMKLRVMESVW